jgi:hypothetical protein
MNLRLEFCRLVYEKSASEAKEWFRGQIVSHVLKRQPAGTFFTEPQVQKWITQLLASNEQELLLLFLECGWRPETEQLNGVKGRPIFQVLLAHSPAILLQQFAPLISPNELPTYAAEIKAKISALTCFENLPLPMLALSPQATWINQILEKRWYFSAQMFELNPQCASLVSEDLIRKHKLQALPFFLIYCAEHNITPDTNSPRFQAMLDCCTCDYLKQYVTFQHWDLKVANWLSKFNLLPRVAITNTDIDYSAATRLAEQARKDSVYAKLPTAWLQNLLTLSLSEHVLHFKVALQIKANITPFANQLALFWKTEHEIYYVINTALHENPKWAPTILKTLMENGKLSIITQLLREKSIGFYQSNGGNQPKLAKRSYRLAARSQDAKAFQDFIRHCPAGLLPDLLTEAITSLNDPITAILIEKRNPTAEQILQILCSAQPMTKTITTLQIKFPAKAQTLQQVLKYAGCPTNPRQSTPQVNTHNVRD